MHTVGRASQLTGIPRDTLRKWESRYGVVQPARSAGGYRLYDDGALRRLAAMRDLVDAGWAPREAAARVLSGSGPVAAPGEPAAGSEDLAQLARAAEEMDPRHLERALRAGLPGDHLAREVDGWLLPSLAVLGRAWREERVSIAGEHFVSGGVHRRLAQLFDAAPRPAAEAPHVVVGLAQGSRHELGVLAFAAVLSHLETRVSYLGGDVPTEAWLSVVRSVGPDGVVVGVPLAEDLPAVREVVTALAGADPGLFVGVGGAHQGEVSSGHGLGHSVGEAAAGLAARLRRPGRPPGNGAVSRRSR